MPPAPLTRSPRCEAGAASFHVFATRNTLEEATRPVLHPHAHRERLRTHPHAYQPASQIEIGARIVTRPASVKAIDRELLLKEGEADILADQACLTVKMVNRLLTDPHARQVAAGHVSRSGREGTPYDRHGKRRTQEQYATPAHGQSRAGPLLYVRQKQLRAGSGSVKSRSSNCHGTCHAPAENHTCDTFATNRSDEPLGMPVLPRCGGVQLTDSEYPSFVLRPPTFDR
jgi:hypothetical protein